MPAGLGSMLLAACATAAQGGTPAAWTSQSGRLAIEGTIETYSAYYAMRGTWWNLSAASAPDFDLSRSFAELWVHPKISGSLKFGTGSSLYSVLSVGATQTFGADAFNYADEGALRFGSAMLGVRGTGAGWSYDVSFGRQPFTLGTGMLLTAGSSNGYSWGGGASAQRKAWGSSMVARASRGALTATAFALEPAEAPEARTDTRVQGAALEWSQAAIGKAGIAWFTVPRSHAIYPGNLAPLAFIDNGRDGLDTWYGWANLSNFVPALPALGLRGEMALQHNDITRADGQRDPMTASAWLLGVSWWAKSLWFAPKFSFHLARFSGDNPQTSSYERFDPMFWGNGLDNWWFGANGSYSWLNANLRAQRFIVDAYLSTQDIVQIQYVHAWVDQLNSAVQFGQGARFTGNQLLVGVPKPELSDEVYLQYSHVFDSQLIATAFLSRSNPGDGLKAVVPQGTRVWTTMGVGLTANF